MDEYGRQDLKNIGSGSGYYITNGRQIPITWQKDSRSAKTLYKTADGEDLFINPGNVYVQIVPTTSQISID